MLRKHRERVAAVLILAAVASLRLIHVDQPIYENYVGRQVPTAMVARNLLRGSGFGSPQLDTGPFPNRFLIEPPIYGAIVAGVHWITGIPLEPSGRLVSGFGMLAAMAGLGALVARRRGPRAGWIAAAVLGIFPLTIRYGRAFQPDALMLGAMMAGLAAWDHSEHRWERRWCGWRALGSTLIALGLMLKALSAFLLVPLVLAILRKRSPARLGLVALTLVPMLGWYLHVAILADPGQGSSASSETYRIWSRSISPAGLLDRTTLGLLVRYVFVRSFTPPGLVLGVIGLLLLLRSGRHPERPRAEYPTCKQIRDECESSAAPKIREPVSDRLWSWWLAATLLFLVLVSRKLHHEYYLLVLAPLMAAGTGELLSRLSVRGARSQRLAWGLGVSLGATALAGSFSTYSTPAEWSTLPAASRLIHRHVAPKDLVVAPEALLYAADRKGCRLEVGRVSEERAAAEWGGDLKRAGSEALEAGDELRLVEFYRQRGATHVADLPRAATDHDRHALQQALRRRYDVLVDTPDLLLVRLSRGTHREKNPDGAVLVLPSQASHAARLRPLEVGGSKDRRAHGVRLWDGAVAR